MQLIVLGSGLLSALHSQPQDVHTQSSCQLGLSLSLHSPIKILHYFHSHQFYCLVKLNPKITSQRLFSTLHSFLGRWQVPYTSSVYFDKKSYPSSNVSCARKCSKSIGSYDGGGISALAVDCQVEWYISHYCICKCIECRLANYSRTP